VLPLAMAVLDPFAPWQLGPITLRNRFIKAATNEGMARQGKATPLLIDHHRAIAAGGAALTTLAYCAVSPDGRTFEQQILLDAAARPSLLLLTDAVHREGGKVSAQITHGGAFTFLQQLESGPPRSACSGFNPPGVLLGRRRKQAMTAAELDATAEQFAEAARQAELAGFDAVEIHMGHGYLLSQFLSPRYNRRRDAWGGDATARAAFPALVLRRVLDAVGKRLAVVCKISVDEACAGGGTVADALAIGRVLQASGAHMLVLSAGMNVESPWAIFGSPLPKTATGPVDSRFARLAARLMLLAAPSTAFKPLYLLEHSRQLRAGLKMPLAYLGGATSLAHAQALLDEGFDAVLMGRALLHEPNLVQQFATGAATRSGCTACNLCVAEMYQPGGTRCVLRPPSDARRNAVPAA
jgi:2,4-dienoyl-CoA reductase (NADPH2)